MLKKKNPLKVKRNVEDQEKNDIEAELKKLPNFYLISSFRAEHCGALYYHFTASNETLKHIVTVAQQCNVHTSVHVVGEVVSYRLSISCCDGKSLLSYLKLSVFVDCDKYNCPLCLTTLVEKQLLEDSKCPKCNQQIDKYWDKITGNLNE